MGARKDKRRKLARKVIRRVLRDVDNPVFIFDNDLTERLSDREFDALVREIRKARVVVKWDA